MTPADVARALDEMALLLELAGASDFRVRAYGHAARAVHDAAGRLELLATPRQLATVRGISGSLADTIHEALTTGRIAELDRLRATTPPALLTLVQVPGLGPKRAKLIFDTLAVGSLDELERACLDGRLGQVKGFAGKTVQRILEAVQFLRTGAGRVRLDRGLRVGTALLDAVQNYLGTARVELTGELRRRVEVVRRVTLLSATDDVDGLRTFLGQLPMLSQLTEPAPGEFHFEATVPYRSGVLTLPGKLLAVPEAEYPVRLIEETGPEAHYDELLLLADALPPAVAFRSEEDVYESLGLQWVPPECRDWPDALAVAREQGFGELVRASDIRGVFHNHTTASDGTATLAEMAHAAGDLGYHYFGLGDHSQSLTVANGLSPQRVAAQWQEGDAWNRLGASARVLKGTECDILAAGKLDFDDELLAGFDYVVASVHTLFHLTEDEQTERVCQALRHPATTMLGHATGRLVLRREGYKIDLERVIDAAAREGKMIEINAQPDRLDLAWDWCRRAKSRGIPLVINPDAHSTSDLEKVLYGVYVARRAGLTKADVFNTQDLDAIQAELARRKSP